LVDPARKKKHASIVIVPTMVMDSVNSTLHDDIMVYIGIKQMKTDTIQTQDIEDDILVHTLYIIIVIYNVLLDYVNSAGKKKS